jgi:hypothetical protein
MAPGEQQSEAGHEYNYGSDSNKGEFRSEHYRDARPNGHIQYTLYNNSKVKKNLGIMLRFNQADHGRMATLTVNGEEYLFQLSTLPGGASVRAYEINRKAAPTDIQSFQSECVFAQFFETEPSIPEGELEISVTHKGIRVKNLTDRDINRDIFLYYKSIQNDTYVGGITYRVKLSGLKAGDEATVYADHATETYTQVMFVEYGE